MTILHSFIRYLSWDTPQEVIAVKSAQNKCSALARQVDIFKYQQINL